MLRMLSVLATPGGWGPGPKYKTAGRADFLSLCLLISKHKRRSVKSEEVLNQNNT